MRVKNWRQFQHYKDRNPPWIKLHFSMLASEDWVSLDDASRVLAIACMLIASRNDGEVPDNPAYVKRVAYLNKLPNFIPLIECGFLELAIESKQMLAIARPETEERQRQSREIPPSGAFLKFWTAWPKHQRKQAQGECWKRWQKQDLDLDSASILAHVETLKASDDWQRGFVPAPLVYINQKRWQGVEAQSDERKVALP